METLVWGTISTKAILEEGKRKAFELFVNSKKRSRDIAYIIAIAKQKGIPVTFCSKETMNEMAPNNGGVILKTETRTFPKLSHETQLDGLCVYISGVEDPYNLGSISRTLYAAGASLMIIQDRDWSNATSTLMRSSAGAWERLNIVTISQDEQLIEVAEYQGRDICSAARDDQAKSLFDCQLANNLLLCIGGAMRGLSSRILNASSEHYYIPYGREFKNALDSVSATSVFSFYWMNQQNNKVQ